MYSIIEEFNNNNYNYFCIANTEMKQGTYLKNVLIFNEAIIKVCNVLKQITIKTVYTHAV